MEVLKKDHELMKIEKDNYIKQLEAEKAMLQM